MNTPTKSLILCLALGLAAPAAIARGPADATPGGPRWQQQDQNGVRSPANGKQTRKQTRQRQRAKDGNCQNPECDGTCDGSCRKGGKRRGKGGGGGRGRGNGNGGGRR